VLAQGAHQEIAPGQELLAQVAPVRAPPRVGDDIEGRGLEQAADVHRLGTSLGQYALAGRDSGPLDQERPVRAYVEDLSVQRCRPLRAGRVGVVRLRVEHASTGFLEGACELDGVGSCGTAGKGHDADTCLLRGEDGSPVRRGLHHQRTPRRDQGAED
jgi:hypothetical protein